MPVPSKSGPFEAPHFANLEDRLLRGGIAPRHVKRYLRELDEHLADLIQSQREAGHDEQAALLRARARLGPDAELAEAMLSQRDFRSFSARFPWAVFGLLPPLGVILGVALPVLLIAVGAKLATLLLLVPRGIVEPVWLQWTLNTLLGAGNLLAMPLVALLLTMIVWRQRLPAWWLLLALAVMAPMMLRAGMDFPETAEIARQKGAALILSFGISRNGALQDGVSLVWLVAQYLLTLTPVAWLLARRHRLGAS